MLGEADIEESRMYEQSKVHLDYSMPRKLLLPQYLYDHHCP